MEASSRDKGLLICGRSVSTTLLLPFCKGRRYITKACLLCRPLAIETPVKDGEVVTASFDGVDSYSFLGALVLVNIEGDQRQVQLAGDCNVHGVGPSQTKFCSQFRRLAD